MREQINQASFEVTDILTASCQYPDILVTKDNQKYATWQQYNEGHDAIYVGKIVDKQVVETKMISGEGEALRPVSFEYDDAVWFVWSECVNREWSILARFVRYGNYSEIITIDTSEAAFYPSVCVTADGLMILWTEQTKAYSRIVAKTITCNLISDKEILSVSDKVYRPTGCEGKDGNLYIAYDRFNGKHYEIVARVKTAGEWSEEKVISTSTSWAANPVVVATGEGVLVGWYHFGAKASFAYLSSDLKVVDGTLVATAPDAFTSSANWYQSIDLSTNKEGIAVFAYTWGKYNINVRYRKPGEAWSEPVTMSYNDGNCGVHPKVTIDDHNTIHLVWQFGNRNGHMDRNASVVYNTLRLDQMDGFADSSIEVLQDQFVRPIDGEKELAKHEVEIVRAWLDKNGYDAKELVFGDIHGQSGMSDGVGEIDQYFHFAKAGADLDFTALTDHDCYQDWISQSEWEWIRTTNKIMNVDHHLSTILAYEWTPNEYKYDFGHKNVYYRGDDGEMFRSGDVAGMTPFNLFESLKKYKAMAIPHHPAADWKLVSAATDWAFHDPEVQRVVEIFSRHAPFEYYGNESKYTKNISQLKHCSVQDALARKYRLGFTAGSDSHQMEHGIEGGIVAAFVPALTRENVFDAIYDRFVYGTTGARILVSLKINGNPMGQEIVVPAGEEVRLEVSVLGTKQVKVELVKNNNVMATKQSDTNACDVIVVDTNRTESDYYYIRVTQQDEHMAWSSPIWVDTMQQ